MATYVVSSGVTVSDVSVNPRDILRVSSGGSALGIVESGGYVWYDQEAEVSFVANTFSGAVTNSGYYMTLHSGTTAVSTTVGSDGKLYIYDGGVASTVGAGGTWSACVFVNNGGRAENVGIGSNAYLYVSDGASVSDLAVGSCGRAVISGGGEAEQLTVGRFANLHVSSNGKATEIKENGGYVWYDEEAEVSFVENTFSGAATNSGYYMTLHSGTTAVSTIVGSDGKLYIYDGGVANTVNASGTWSACVFVNNGGRAENVGIGSNAYLYVADGASVSKVSIGSYGLAVVSGGGEAEQLTVGRFANLHVSSNGKATDIKENGGAVWYDEESEISFVANTFSGAITSRGYYMTLHSGTTAVSTIVGSDGKLYIYDGGVANTVNASGTWSACVFVNNGGRAENVGIGSNAYLYVADGASVSKVSIGSYGLAVVSGGGEAEQLTVGRFAKLHVSSNGKATDIKENGGYVAFDSNANVNFVKNTFSGAITSRGYYMTLHSGTTAVSTTVGSDGRLYIYDGGVASKVGVSGTWSACVFVGNGARVGDADIGKNGYLYINGGAVASNTKIGQGGRVYVSSAGRADGVTVNSVGLFYVSSGAVVTALDVRKGGAAYISSGGRVAGQITLVDSSTLFVSKGGIVDFDITAAAPGGAALVNNLALVNGTPDYAITVSAAQTAGAYRLADGAATFDKTVTVATDAGKTLGVIKVGGSIVSGGYTYSLALADGRLSLTVAGGALASSADLNGDGRADVVMSITQKGHGAEGATGAWLIQENQTAAWGDLSTRNAGWSIFGKGLTTAGKTTADVYLKSDGNIVGAWTTDTTGKVTGWTTVGEFDSNTQVLGLGDFDGDRQTDLLLRNTNGAVGCHLTDGTGWHYFQSLGPEWKIAAVGDLNGDGRDDVVLKHDVGFAGSWLTQDDCTMAWADLDTLPSGYIIVGTGDFNGDGTDDVLLKNGNYYGAWLVRNGNAAGWFGIGDLGNVAVEEIADYDADGIDDLRIRTAAGDLGAQLVKGADTLEWKYYGSVGQEWSTTLAAI